MRLSLLPAPGLISDDTDFSLPGRYSDADNVRWVLGKPQTIGGWVKYFGSQLSGVCRNVLSWYDMTPALNIAFGTHTNLYVYLNGTLYDITPAGLVAGAEDGVPGGGFGAGDYGEGDYGEGSPSSYFARTWSLQTWGQSLLANPRAGKIYAWDNNTANDATEIVNAPDEVNAILVTPERQVLALGCNEEVSGTFNPLCIRGCDIEDYTDWTTSSSNNAFEHILEGGGGRIVSGRMLGAFVAVWTDQAIYLGQFLGDPAQTYRFDLIATNCGLIGPNAVQIVNGRAFWMAPDRQIMTMAPGETPAPIPCPIQAAFRDDIANGQADKIAATSISQFGEVWWFIPHSDDGDECSRYISLKLEGSPLWSKGTLARSAVVDAGATPNPIFVSPDGYAYSHENGQSADGGALSWSFTVSLPYLEDGGRFALIKGIEPDIKDQAGAVSVSFLMKKYPQSEGYAKGPYTLPPMTVRKDFLLQGRSGEITFSGSSSPTFARFGQPVLIAEPTGRE